MPEIKKITIKYYKILTFAAILLLGVFLFLGFSQNQKNQTETNLTQEDVASKVKPAVVRILHVSTGEIVIPSFTVNLEAKQLIWNKSIDKKIIKIDRVISGSGFVVNPDGYIVTNSHVVSSAGVKAKYIQDILDKELDAAGLGYTDADMAKYFSSQKEWTAFRDNSLLEISKNSEFNVEETVKVLNPSTVLEDLNGLMSEAFDANILSVNDSYAADEKDTALLKINAKNLPSLKINSEEIINVGKKIYIFGFPASGDVNSRSPLESTFTTGLISASKFSQNKSFKIFQTDAKISQGSSGGPLLNEKGEVVGIITFETGEELRKTGDNFAFAIPIEIAQANLKNKSVENLVGDISENYSLGISQAKRGECTAAITNLEQVEKNANTNFNLKKYTTPYLEKCKEEIKNQSVFFSILKYFKKFVWIFAFGFSLLICFAFLTIYNFEKRLKKEESKILELEQKLEDEILEKENKLTKLSEKGIQLPIPGVEIHAEARQKLNIAHPHLVDYIKEARAIGMVDKHIEEEIKKAGWSEDETKTAFKNI